MLFSVRDECRKGIQKVWEVESIGLDSLEKLIADDSPAFILKC